MSDDAVAVGADFGLGIPAHPEALRRAGPAFLTEAMRAYGRLAPDDAVTAITRFEPFPGGNSGLKVVLDVSYAQPQPGAPTALFVKFSRDLTDPFRDRRRHELAAEVRLAHLSRHPAFPVAVPAPCFADFDPASGTGILITERVPFGSAGVLPPHVKCRDHELPDRMERYVAVVEALAALAAAQRSGRLAPLADTLFPFDAAAVGALLTIPAAGAALADKAARIAGFVAGAPQLFPFADAGFIARLPGEIAQFGARAAEVRAVLLGDPDMVALCHWNGNLDNAWFWREADGVMRCGLLDWGMVQPMNVGMSLWGALSAASPDLWEGDALDGLLDRFAHALRAGGGPVIAPERLALHFDLSVAMLGLALMLDGPALVAARLPDYRAATHRLDPVLRADQVAHGFLHVFTAFLELWARRDFAGVLARALR